MNQESKRKGSGRKLEQTRKHFLSEKEIKMYSPRKTNRINFIKVSPLKKEKNMVGTLFFF